MSISENSFENFQQYSIAVTINSDLFAGDYQYIFLKLIDVDDLFSLFESPKFLPPIAKVSASNETDCFR